MIARKPLTTKNSFYLCVSACVSEPFLGSPSLAYKCVCARQHLSPNLCDSSHLNLKSGIFITSRGLWGVFPFANLLDHQQRMMIQAHVHPTSPHTKNSTQHTHINTYTAIIGPPPSSDFLPPLPLRPSWQIPPCAFWGEGVLHAAHT